MTTKADFLLSKDKQQSYTNGAGSDSEQHNLKLNQRYKCLSVVALHSKSKPFNDKYYATSIDTTESKSKKRWKTVKSNATNKSTLSLHILVYENSAESPLLSEDTGNKDQKVDLFKPWKSSTKKWYLSNDNIPEYPRQQPSKVPVPEVAQYKSSQSLLNPSSSGSKNASKSGSVTLSTAIRTKMTPTKYCSNISDAPTPIMTENERNLDAGDFSLTNLHHSTTTEKEEKEKIETEDVYLKKSTDFYYSNRILGEGAYSKVIKGIYLETEERVAIKFILPQDPEATVKELKAMKILNGASNIASLLGYFFYNNYICFAIEFLDGFALSQLINASKNGLFDYQTAKYMSQIASALQFCHERGIIHRDAKPENIMITTEDIAKLIDFGLCEFFESSKTKFTDQIGTVEYLAPEIVIHRKHSKEIDYWCLGILTFECLTKRTPYRNPSDGHEEIVARIKKNKKANGFEIFKDECLKRCIKGLLQYDPSKRMNLNTFIQHRWVLSMHQKANQICLKN